MTIIKIKLKDEYRKTTYEIAIILTVWLESELQVRIDPYLYSETYNSSIDGKKYWTYDHYILIESEYNDRILKILERDRDIIDSIKTIDTVYGRMGTRIKPTWNRRITMGIRFYNTMETWTKQTIGQVKYGDLAIQPRYIIDRMGLHPPDPSDYSAPAPKPNVRTGTRDHKRERM